LGSCEVCGGGAQQGEEGGPEVYLDLWVLIVFHSLGAWMAMGDDGDEDGGCWDLGSARMMGRHVTYSRATLNGNCAVLAAHVCTKRAGLGTQATTSMPGLAGSHSGTG
jgi:hypothetical protein